MRAAAILAPLLFGLAGAPALAQAASSSSAQGTTKSSTKSTTTSAIDAILQNDFEIGGQVSGNADVSSLPATVDLNVSGLPLQVTLNGQSIVQVGPYAADPSFLLDGVSVKVWFHVDENGNAIADLVVIAPTVVKGALLSDQNLDAQDPSRGQVLSVAVPAQNGSPAQTVEVDVLADTTVKLLPPWAASAGLAAANQVAAVGVMDASGTLVAAMVVGVVSKKS